MDKETGEIGEALDAALRVRSPHTPPAELRARLLRDVARRGHPRADTAWTAWALRAGAVVVLTLLAASAVWGVSLSAALSQERSLRAQLEDAAARDEVVFDVVDARNVSKTTLRAPNDDSPTAPYAKVFVRPDMPYVVAMAGRLPLAPSGREYHVYLDGRRIGTIAPNDAGFGYFVFRADEVGITYKAARVVLEPSGASDASGLVVLASPQR